MAGTNWDRGLASAADAAQLRRRRRHHRRQPDHYSDPAAGPSGSFNRSPRGGERHLLGQRDQGPQGRRVIGIRRRRRGRRHRNTALNLRSISGPTAYNGVEQRRGRLLPDDRLRRGGRRPAGAGPGQLQGLALGRQAGRPHARTPGEVDHRRHSRRGGWTFDGRRRRPSVRGLPATKTTTSDGTGSVNFPLDVPRRVTDTAGVTVTETQQAGLHPAAGRRPERGVHEPQYQPAGADHQQCSPGVHRNGAEYRGRLVHRLQPRAAGAGSRHREQALDHQQRGLPPGQAANRVPRQPPADVARPVRP